MKVYRWEHSFTHRGPYNSGSYFSKERELVEELIVVHNGWDNMQTHPVSHLDNLPTGAGWVSGCDSLEALDKWFEGFTDERMKAANYVKLVFEVPEEHFLLGRSGLQCAFRRDRAVLVTTL